MANRKLNSIKFPDIADTYILDADKVNYDDSETYASGSVGKALQNKANIDGSYSDLTAGNAEQLVSNVRVNDKTPYLFRTSGGSVDIGDREYVNGIVGGTVAWNQLVQNGDFSNGTTGWGVEGGTAGTVSNNVLPITASAGNYTGINRSISITASHKYLLTTKMKITSSASEIQMRFVLSNGGVGDTKFFNVSPGSWKDNDTIISATDNWQKIYIISAYGQSTSHLSSGDVIEMSNVQVINLTQMFGSTIADYIYSLETATAGAGVAWFKKLFNKPYYAYNAGELKSVSGLASHDMTGFNQWDEEWEVGGIDHSTGQNAVNSTVIRSKNYIPVISNTSYFFKVRSGSSGGLYVHYYDADKNYLSYEANIDNVTRTIPSNACFVRFNSTTVYGNVYTHDICINLAWDNSRNGEYEPYDKHSYPLDTDLTLRGIPKLDANNNLYYDGDVYEADGTVTRKYGVVDLGTLTWTLISSGLFYTNGIISLAKTGQKGLITAKYVTLNESFASADASGYADKIIAWNANNAYLYIKDTAYSDASTLKTALDGVYLVYELAEPTEETTDAYVGTQIVNDFGTEEYVISNNTFAVPVGHDTDYPVNLVAKLEMAPNSPEGNGDYIVRQTNGMNEYVPLVIEDALPTIPSETGSYKLTVTVTEGSDPVLSWTAE